MNSADLRGLTKRPDGGTPLHAGITAEVLALGVLCMGCCVGPLQWVRSVIAWVAQAVQAGVPVVISAK